VQWKVLLAFDETRGLFLDINNAVIYNPAIASAQRYRDQKYLDWESIGTLHASRFQRAALNRHVRSEMKHLQAEPQQYNAVLIQSNATSKSATSYLKSYIDTSKTNSTIKSRKPLQRSLPHQAGTAAGVARGGAPALAAVPRCGRHQQPPPPFGIGVRHPRGVKLRRFQQRGRNARPPSSNFLAPCSPARSSASRPPPSLLLLLVLPHRRRKRGVIDHPATTRSAGPPRVPDTCVSGVCVSFSLSLSLSLSLCLSRPWG